MQIENDNEFTQYNVTSFMEWSLSEKEPCCKCLETGCIVILELISVGHLFHISDKLFPCMIVLSFYFINYYNVHFFGFWISRLRWFQFVQKMNFRNLIPFHLRNARYLRFLFLFHISYELLLLYKNKHIGWSMLSGYITFCKVAERDFLQIGKW